MFQEDNVDAVSVGALSLIGGIVTLVLILLTQVYFYRVQKQDDAQKTVVSGPTEVGSLKEAQLSQLKGYRVLDPESVALPIDRAMELTVHQLATSGQP